MFIVRDLLRGTWLLLICLSLLAVFHASEPLREGLANKLAPGFAYTDEDAVAKRSRDECKADARARNALAICSLPMSTEAWNYEREYIDEPTEFFEESAALGLGVLAFGLFVRVLLNIHSILKGRFNVNLMNAPRALMRFIRSRKAELSLRRYKRLLDTGVLSEEEFSAKRQELKSTILSER